MSIPIDSQCIQCHLRRNLETARKLGTQAQATAFAKDLMRLYLEGRVIFILDAELTEEALQQL